MGAVADTVAVGAAAQRHPLLVHVATAAAAGAAAPHAAAGIGAPALRYRALQPSDFVEVKAAHAQLFPIDYEDAFFNRATTSQDRCVAPHACSSVCVRACVCMCLGLCPVLKCVSNTWVARPVHTPAGFGLAQRSAKTSSARSTWSASSLPSRWRCTRWRHR